MSCFCHLMFVVDIINPIFLTLPVNSLRRQQLLISSEFHTTRYILCRKLVENHYNKVGRNWLRKDLVSFLSSLWVPSKTTYLNEPPTVDRFHIGLPYFKSLLKCSPCLTTRIVGRKSGLGDENYTKNSATEWKLYQSAPHIIRVLLKFLFPFQREGLSELAIDLIKSVTLYRIS